MCQASAVGSTSQAAGEPLCAQYTLSISSLVLGLILTVAGVFAYLAIRGGLPPDSASSLQRFGGVGLNNSYFMMAGGALLTILATTALFWVFRKQAISASEAG